MVRRTALLVSASLALISCGAPAAQVSTERADRIRSASLDPAPDSTPDSTPSSTDPDATSPDTVPDSTPDTAEPTVPVVPDAAAIDFGENKPERSYDDFLLTALADIAGWLAIEFPTAYGEPWEPLAGKIYAAYPERSDPLPGCGSGEEETTYEDLRLFVAFYCPVGDFIVYDDGDDPIRLPDGTQIDPILYSLAEQFGPATIGIVLAHEYGHAVQQRIGVVGRAVPTVVTEQQADCFAGAWAGRAAAGGAAGLTFTDDDVRAGLISMITVQDPVGIDPTAPGGHGSGFDRVGAFQVGFRDGFERCTELIDDPLPLTPLQFSTNDVVTGGNAPFGFDADRSELFSFLVPDLNLLYDNDLDEYFPDFERLELIPTQTEAQAVCGEAIGVYDEGVVLCPESNVVYLNEPQARALYDEFGDFAPGYLLGIAWAEAAQISNDSPLVGEERQLRNDCLTGAWVSTVIPDEDFLLPEPRDPGRSAQISPNDLTEAIQTAILIGDETADTDLRGSAFEKIDAFRRGTLNGIDACD